MAKSQISNPKTIIARARFVKDSPRKLRWVADSVRDLSPQVAIDRLKLMPQRAAQTLLPVFQQAVGNAKNNFKLSPERLVVKSLQVQEGPRTKQRARGARSGTWKRRKSHVVLELEEKDGA